MDKINDQGAYSKWISSFYLVATLLESDYCHNKAMNIPKNNHKFCKVFY